MKLLTLALLLSLPTGWISPKKSVPQPATQLSRHTRGGRWYFAASGHAVYCYGPVMTVPGPSGALQRVATLCRDGSPVVPLKD